MLVEGSLGIKRALRPTVRSSGLILCHDKESNVLPGW